MKVLTFLVSICFFNLQSIQSQIRIAIVGGLHQSEVLEENNLPSFELLKNNYKKRTGAHFGFLADIPFSTNSKFSFQPAVTLQNKGRKLLYSVDSTYTFKRPGRPDSTVDSRFIEDQRQFINYIDIPLNIVYKLPLGKNAKFIIGAGPYLSLFYNGFDKRELIFTGVNAENVDIDDLPVGKQAGQYAILNYGVNGLLGIEGRKVFLTVNFSRGLNDYYKPKDYTGSYKHQLIGATIGIFLGKPVEDIIPVKDKDQDGIADTDDLCPEVAGGALTKGCPDKDGDGIADKDDLCPNEPGSLVNKGCPVKDSDQDGITDEQDKCPAEAGLAKYQGCPIPDTDKDGINNEMDQCPDVAGLSKYNGCPVPDSDGDEINDEEDKCPQVKGTREKNGCPDEVQKEIVEKINYAAKRIQFLFSKADLQQSSYTVLNEVASILKLNPQLLLNIEGHSSNDGKFDINMKLSQSRAENVKKYLVSQGIEESRMTAKGFGPTQPLNKGTTEAEKALNRRVELKLSY